jgi:hypothetical protein
MRTEMHVTSFPAQPGAYSFVTYEADWEGDWPASPEAIFITLSSYPVIGFMIESPGDDDREPFPRAVYLQNGNMTLEDRFPEDWGETDIPVGTWPNPTDHSSLIPAAQSKCFSRMKMLKHRMARKGT